METEGKTKRKQRPRRNFSDDSKAGAVALVLKEGKSVTQVSKDLDLTVSCVGKWVEQAGGSGQEHAQHADDRREGRAHQAAEGGSRAWPRARNSKEGDGLLRQGERVGSRSGGEGPVRRGEIVPRPARLVCGLLRVVPSPEERTRSKTKLKVLVNEAHTVEGRTYNGPRVHRSLKKQGVPVSRKRIVRLMQEDGLVGRARRRFKHTTDSDHACQWQPICSRATSPRARPTSAGWATPPSCSRSPGSSTSR